MSGRFAIAAVFLLAACQKPAIPAEDLLVRVEVEGREVGSGRPFPLRVVRIWSASLQPEPWTDLALQPLVVRQDGVSRREDGQHVEEVRSFAAYAFGSGRMTVPAVACRARDAGGAERMASSARIQLDVASALPPDAPAAPELPLALLPLPGRSWLLPAAGALLLIAGSLWFVQRARRRPQLPPPPPEAEAKGVPAPGNVARERLAMLRAAMPATREQVEAFHEAAAAVMREYVGERFAVPARERTTGELLRAAAILRAVQTGDLALLAQVLRQCDLVKFARYLPDAAAQSRLLATAEQFVAAVDGAAAGGQP